MRKETIKFSDFMDGSYKSKKKEVIKTPNKWPFAVGASAGILSPMKALAATSAVTVTKITETDPSQLYDVLVTAFKPLIQLAQAFAYPIASVVVIGGALYIMVGNKDKGFQMMQQAAVGYVMVRIAPMVLDIVVASLKTVGFAIML